MRLRLAILILAGAASLFGAYTYDYPPATYTTNGSFGAVYVGGVWLYQASTAGAYILIPSVSGNANDYEVKTGLSPATGGGVFVHYLRASSGALATSGSCTGSYLSSELSIPTGYTGGTAAGTLSINQCSSGTLSHLGGVSLGVPVNSVLRSVIYGTTLLVYLNDRLVVSQTVASTTGQPGVGGYSMASATGYASFYFGHRDTTAPSAVSATGVKTSVLPGQVSLQWPGAADDTNGIGVYSYAIARNGTVIGGADGAAFTDNTVSPSTTYTYSISAVDFHGNAGPATTVSVTTPPATAVDPRRIGVSSTGSYWGGGGEQLDMLSGNLHFSLPLISAQGRTGWSVPVGLSYNSQNWRQDGGANWQLGADAGYGYGWKLQIGSITPFYTGTGGGVHHYLFTDGTGAEYQLDQHSGNIWSSTQGIYVWFDDYTNQVHFKNGMSWYMGCLSQGTEPDAGTFYPTVIQDPNGNLVTVKYLAAASLPTYLTNTSGKISSVVDMRGSGSTSYSFGWGSGHLWTITNSVGTAESYSFSYTAGAGVMPPFGYDSSYSGVTTTQLSAISVPVAGSYQFSYDSGGANELLKVQFPWGGYLRWTYATATYAGGRLLREIDNRYMYSSATTGGAEYGPYPLTHSDSGVGGGIPIVHADTTLVDASGNGAKTWTFNNSSGSAWQIGLASQFDQKASATGTVITTDSFTWSQTPTSGNPYISQKVSVRDPGTGAAASAQTNQSADQYGNTTQVVVYPYNNSTTPLATYNSTFVTSSSYVDEYIRGLLASATVTVGTTTTTLVTNTYDHCTGAVYYTSGPPVYSYDSTAALLMRGNLTSSVSPGGTTSACYYNYGPLYSTTGIDGTTSYTASSSATDWRAPDTITTPTYSDSLTYNSWVGLTATTGANGETMYMTYDSLGRPATAKSPYWTSGSPTETYAYSSPGTVPAWQTSTGADGFTRTTLDGFGRAILVERGPSSGSIVSKVETVYAPCACSPLGKLQKTSQPYAPGGTVYWTQYTYDGIGRTLTVQGPDGASTATYAYAGSQTTVTDPAGKWKKMTSDVSGNLLTVEEPDPTSGSGGTLITYYTYDSMNHLTCVDMTRGGTAASLYTYSSGGVTCTTGYTGGTRQTRTFVYDSAGQFTSATNPESGTVAYTYNSDHTLQKKQDAKGQVSVYTYDSAKRVTEVQVYPYGTGSSEDACQRVTYGYDSGTNGLGRLTSTQYGANATSGTCPGTPAPRSYQESYSYHAAGAVTGKTMSVVSLTAARTWGVFNHADISMAYAYDSAGRLSTTKVNGANTTAANGTFTNTYDGMGRLVSMADNNPFSFSGTGVTWVQNGQYDAAGRMTGVQLFVGSSMVSDPSFWSSMKQQTMGYNANGQLTSLHWETYLPPYAGHNPRDLQYSYSATQNNGQITQMADATSGETVSYAYDALSRLTSASSSPIVGTTPAAWTQMFQYDGFGNLTSKVLNGGSNTAPAVTAGTNRLSGSSYDANGNMLTGVGATFTYDGRNRMFSATPTSGGTEYYGYAPDNKRVYRLAASGAETWTFYGARGERVCDFGISPIDTNSPTVITAKNFNVWFGGKLIAKVDTFGSFVSTQRDRVGTDRETGARYYPYGEEITSTADDTEKFATYLRDSFTKLDYADQRYYASSYGRFDTVDGGPSNLGVPQSFNRYAYAGGDPVNSSDPSGLCTVDSHGNYWDDWLASPYDNGASTQNWGGGNCSDNWDWLQMVEHTAAGGVWYNDQWFIYTTPEPDACLSAENSRGCGGSGGGGGGTGGSGGGGGGDGSQIQIVPKTAAKYGQNVMEALTAGFNNALDHANTLDCASLFMVGSAVDGFDDFADVNVLENTTYRILQLPTGTGAETIPASTDVFLNSEGAFFNNIPNRNGTLTVRMPNLQGKITPVTFANSAALQGFMLLHELGHEMGIFGPDKNLQINGANSMAVLDNCYSRNAEGVYY